jgi:5-methylcytosine-specific restriction endonuclease McrA
MNSRKPRPHAICANCGHERKYHSTVVVSPGCFIGDEPRQDRCLCPRFIPAKRRRRSTSLRRESAKAQARRKIWQTYIRPAIMQRDGACALCGLSTEPGPYKRFHVHHVIPRKQGGRDVAENLVLLCGGNPRCCHEKVHADPRKYRPQLVAYLASMGLHYDAGSLTQQRKAVASDSASTNSEKEEMF